MVSKGSLLQNFLSKKEFENLRMGIQSTIKKIIRNELDIETNGFSLEKYHKYVKDDYSHLKIVSKTRDLFEKDFPFQITSLIPKFEKILNLGLTDINTDTKEKAHIIIRINRPNSYDYNPPHKDIYEQYDAKKILPKFINFWIPISGVTSKTSLPIVEGSHLLTEDKITRTCQNSFVGKNEYRVRYVKNWGSNSLTRPKVNYGQVLIFSSHLIHGLAKNNEDNITRTALEFRLFKKNNIQ